MRVDPVVIAVLAAVLDQPVPRLAPFQRLPEVGKGRCRHFRMADDVVALAEQFAFGETGNGDEIGIDVGDDAAQVGLADDGRPFVHDDFAVGDRQIGFHGSGPRRAHGQGSDGSLGNKGDGMAMQEARLLRK
ncbi:hypothetical protein SDC9_172851 [bioreactor metagenome]|uniref:Uncharacterized protein n=1 Tax=bioreactor metagenome TaxID=1076179 RepID=A0A645GHH6_9ZZZZ